MSLLLMLHKYFVNSSKRKLAQVLSLKDFVICSRRFNRVRGYYCSLEGIYNAEEGFLDVELL